MEMVTNRYITTRTHIDGAPNKDDFELRTEALPLVVDSDSNDVIVKTLYVSVDPYQINRMKKYSVSQGIHSNTTSIKPGMEISAFGVGRVVASGHPDFQENDLVKGVLNWGEYTIVKGGTMLNKLDSTMGFPLSFHVGVLGTSGFTAYGGFFEVCNPKKGEKVFVSAASGSVGNLVGQYAKLLGCYVVGSAGSQGKVDLLKEKLGFDDAFNYKNETDLKLTLKRYFPEGIDIYFDNVGGDMLEAAVANMNLFGRVSACGVISEYTDSGKRAAPNMIDVVYKRIRIQGFLAMDFMNIHAEFISKTADYLRSGKMQSIEDISRGIESVPSAFMDLFRGYNVGKKIVQIADD